MRAPPMFSPLVVIPAKAGILQADVGMSLPKYPEYKDSETRWLGDMPAHWSVQRYKHVFVEREERSETGHETLLSVSAYTGVSPRSEIVEAGNHLSRAESLEGYKVCYPGDLVMNIMLAWNRGLGFSAYHGIVSPAYSVFEPRLGNCPRFLDYMVRSDQVIVYYKAFSAGVIDSRLRLYPDTFGALYCLLPPYKEQVAIAAFLDRETAKIDALIAEQEKLITLLTEKRQATISHAVTRGLNPNAPMKDSGVLWLGEVPAHWEVAMLRRFVVSFEQGWSPECESRPAENGEWGVLKAGCVNGGDFSAVENKALPPSLVARPELEVKSGDVLISRASGSPKLIGSVAYVKCPPSRLMLSDKIFRLRLATGVDPEFFALLMRSLTLRQQIEQAIGGATGLANNLPQASIKEFWLAVPSNREQREIVGVVFAELERLCQLAEAAMAGIELLKERRSALIAAAVTGQIDVRGAVEGIAA